VTNTDEGHNQARGGSLDVLWVVDWQDVLDSGHAKTKGGVYGEGYPPRHCASVSSA
jgi:hypothetical protein